ncbi:MAG: transposase [Clostridia bacterium]|nr:transposase [Clostridia bacterium]
MNEKKPERKNPRLQGFDYNTPGVYFITICTDKRKNFLSTIVGDGSPIPKLTAFGEITDKQIRKIPEKYKNVTVDNSVIMPNHIHLLLSVNYNNGMGNPSPTISSVIAWLKYQITKNINNEKNTVGEKIFQRSFYDHIVRNQNDYDEIYNYISENPLRWKLDKLYNEG